MNRWIVPLLVLGLPATAARAQNTLGVEVSLNVYRDYDVQTHQNAPDNHVHTEDCQNADSVWLSITWDASEAYTYQPWLDAVEADVFLSTSETCESAAVEIGEVRDEGVDVTINSTVVSGQYPQSGDEDLFLSDITGLGCGTETEEDYYFCIRWEYESYTGYSTITYTYRGGDLLRFDQMPPGTPGNVLVSPGEENLKVSWEKPGDEDIGSYRIYYRLEGSEDEPSYQTEENGERETYTLTGLVNYETYEVWVVALDESMNEGEPSEIMTGMPEPVQDFYEAYKDAGGQEQGGFCFVATAAWGSYGHAMVQPLRAFRDTTLAASAPGRSLIDGYYRYGPRWARAIRGSAVHRGLARVALLPAAAFAGFSNAVGFTEALLLLAGAVLLAWLAFCGLRRLRCAWLRRAAPLVAVVCLLGTSSGARAAEGADFQLQLRFGPYYPNVDSESFPDLDRDAGEIEPFKKIYGSSSEFLFEAGLDYEIWHGFGTVTVGGSFGFVQYLGKARTQTGEKSSDTTVFNLVPLRLTAGYHFDLLADKWNIPVVPYLSGGLSYYFWWALDGVGDTATWTDPDGDEHDATGGIFGLHFSAGLKLLLDFLDEEAASNLQNDVGVVNTYLFVEFALSWVDGFGSSNHMDVGDETIMFGLMMEL